MDDQDATDTAVAVLDAALHADEIVAYDPLHVSILSALLLGPNARAALLAALDHGEEQ